MTLNIDEANGITKGLRLIRCKEPHTNYPKYKHLWGYETTAHDVLGVFYSICFLRLPILIGAAPIGVSSSFLSSK